MSAQLVVKEVVDSDYVSIIRNWWFDIDPETNDAWVVEATGLKDIPEPEIEQVPDEVVEELEEHGYELSEE